MDRVTKHTRAGRAGKKLICPNCNSLTSGVIYFSWKTMVCKHCKADVPKTKWFIKPTSSVKPKSCVLCGRSTIYPTQLDHPYHHSNLCQCYNCGFNQNDSTILKLAIQVDLQCPYITQTRPWERCMYMRTVNPDELKGVFGISGNGGYYSNLYYRCPDCNQYVDGVTLINNNLEILRPVMRI